MKNYQFGFTHRPALRLSRIEEILKQTRIIEPVPSRPTLIKLIEAGTLNGHKVGNAYLVDEESFHAWVKSVHPELSTLIQPSPAHRLRPKSLKSLKT